MRLTVVIIFIQSFALGCSVAATSPSSLQCYKCVNAVDLSDCTYVQCDSNNEDCYMERDTTDSGRDVYNAGCKSSVICQAYGSSGSISSIGRKRARASCLNCCHSDKCNNNLCGIPPGNVPYTPSCYVCDSRVSNSVQNEVRHPEDCTHQALCQPNEVCIAEISVVGITAYHYFGCKSKLLCRYAMNNTFDSLNASGNTGGKRQVGICSACCGDSGCNHDDCYTVRDKMYTLYKNNQLDFDTLRAKRTSG